MKLAADPDAFPVRFAVIVPAEKLPEASLLTIVEAVFAFVAAVVSFTLVATAEAVLVPTLLTTVAPCVPVTSPTKLPVKLAADPDAFPVRFPVKAALTVDAIISLTVKSTAGLNSTTPDVVFLWNRSPSSPTTSKAILSRVIVPLMTRSPEVTETILSRIKVVLPEILRTLAVLNTVASVVVTSLVIRTKGL